MCFFQRNGMVEIWQAKGDPKWNETTLCFEDTMEYQTIPLAEYFRYSLSDWPSRWDMDSFVLVSRFWPGDPNWVDPRPPGAVEDPNDVTYEGIQAVVAALSRGEDLSGTVYVTATEYHPAACGHTRAMDLQSAMLSGRKPCEKFGDKK